MTDAIRFAYGISHLVALAALAFSGFWRVCPLFLLALASGSILAVTYHPESPEWTRNWFLTMEPAAVVLRYVAAMEVLWCLSKEIPGRLRLLIGVSLISDAILLTVWVIEPGSDVFTFVQIRRYVQIGTAVFMIAAVTFIWVVRMWKWDVLGVHAVILLILTVKQAAYSMLSMRGSWGGNDKWRAADWPGLLITTLCCLTWAGLALYYGRKNVQPSKDAYR